MVGKGLRAVLKPALSDDFVFYFTIWVVGCILSCTFSLLHSWVGHPSFSQSIPLVHGWICPLMEHQPTRGCWQGPIHWSELLYQRNVKISMTASQRVKNYKLKGEKAPFLICCFFWKIICKKKSNSFFFFHLSNIILVLTLSTETPHV